MVAVILGCSSLAGHVEAAQAKMQTNYPFIALERKYHVNPKQMRVEILQALQQLPAEVDTVLVAMGFCGGSWQNVAARQRLVLPCVDDCITLLLHTDGERHFNLKQKNHFYLRDTDEGEYSLEGIYQGLCQKNGSAKGAEIFNSWFAPFTDADIIDTGVYDCYAGDYLAAARRNADLAKCRLNHVVGSNLLLEKLVSGQWDKQFGVVEPAAYAVTADLFKDE